jgi:hypothetical protein
MEIEGQDHNIDQGPNFFGLPRPVTAPAYLAPDKSGKQSAGQQDHRDFNIDIHVLVVRKDLFRGEQIGECQNKPAEKKNICHQICYNMNIHPDVFIFGHQGAYGTKFRLQEHREQEEQDHKYALKMNDLYIDLFLKEYESDLQ